MEWRSDSIAEVRDESGLRAYRRCRSCLPKPHSPAID